MVSTRVREGPAVWKMLGLQSKCVASRYKLLSACPTISWITQSSCVNDVGAAARKAGAKEAWFCGERWRWRGVRAQDTNKKQHSSSSSSSAHPNLITTCILQPCKTGCVQ